jgi:hypothetical protein
MRLTLWVIRRNADCFAGAAVEEIVVDITSKADIPEKEKQEIDALLEGEIALYAIQGDESDRF